MVNLLLLELHIQRDSSYYTMQYTCIIELYTLYMYRLVDACTYAFLLEALVDIVTIMCFLFFYLCRSCLLWCWISSCGNERER